MKVAEGSDSQRFAMCTIAGFEQGFSDSFGGSESGAIFADGSKIDAEWVGKDKHGLEFGATKNALSKFSLEFSAFSVGGIGLEQSQVPKEKLRSLMFDSATDNAVPQDRQILQQLVELWPQISSPSKSQIWAIAIRESVRLDNLPEN